ncbi:MAG: hypothetical protein ACLTYW_00900 [Collinsella sp.]
MPSASTTPWAHRSPRPSAFVAQSILMRKLPFQPVAVRSRGTAAYGSLKAYGDPNRRTEERNARIEYLATESDDSILGPEEVDIHE